MTTENATTYRPGDCLDHSREHKYWELKPLA